MNKPKKYITAYGKESDEHGQWIDPKWAEWADENMKILHQECNTVSSFEENIAIEYGVVIVFLDPALSLKGHAKQVVAISFRTGNSIRRGNELWVRSELEKMKVKILNVITLKNYVYLFRIKTALL